MKQLFMIYAVFTLLMFIVVGAINQVVSSTGSQEGNLMFKQAAIMLESGNLDCVVTTSPDGKEEIIFCNEDGMKSVMQNHYLGSYEV